MSLTAGLDEGTAKACVILTTTETEAEARTLATGLLEQSLAACIQLSRIDSLYLWEGEVASEPEIRLVIKTRHSLRAAASAYIEAHHPYDVPQVIVLEASGVAPGYLDWLFEVTGTGSS